MSEKKKPHGVQLLIRTVVTDPNGKVIHDSGQKPAKSFVIQFLEFLYGLFSQPTVQATDVNGAEEYIYGAFVACNKTLVGDAGINIDNHGIVVGTGDTAETNTDHALETQLTEGIGAGNITHGAMTIETTGVVGANVDLETKRSFPNNTGSTITIKEAGLYISVSEAGIDYFCIIRDVLGAPGVDVPDMCALTVYYTLRTTV